MKNFFTKLFCSHLPLVRHERVEGKTHSYVGCYICGKKLSHGVETGGQKYRLTERVSG